MHDSPYAPIAEKIATWHRSRQRDLPWRTAPPGERSAYTVWISEVMSQQTRLATVVNYFERWMNHFPDVDRLADAELQTVLKLWEGLGYYSRARNIHRAARIIVDEYDGQIPQDRQALLALPGIGEYTAGAILSLAFGKAEPILDGNVKRVLTRLWDIGEPIEKSSTVKQLWGLAAEMAQARPGQAGEVNEGMMELGATICLPRNPHCLLCPVRSHCTALDHGTQNERPVRIPRRKTPHFDVAAAVIWQGERFASPLLIAQRPEDGMLGGLWEFPGGKMEDRDGDLAACLRREISEELGVPIRVDTAVTRVDHAYTHFKITLYAFHASILSGTPRSIGVADWRWIDLDEIESYPFPVTDRKVITALRKEKNVVGN